MEPLNRRQHGVLLLILVPVLATVASHVVFYRRFPWQTDYQFPIAYFLTVSTVILSCWSVNLLIFRLLDRNLPFSYNPARRIGRQLLLGGFATLLTFSVVFPNAIRLYTGFWPNAVQLTSGVFVCITIATLVNGGYVGLYLLEAFRLEKQQAAENLNEKLSGLQQTTRPVSEAAVLIDFGARQLRFRPDEIAYFFSTQGLVLLVKTDGQQLTTHYNSFAKLENQLPANYFFQLNRQFIVSVQAVRSVQDDSNRKLIVTLTPSLHKNQPEETVTVSRYRNVEFRKWLQQLAVG
ncbi:LytR/AlgR family response regulator transcription factor [Larkinella terrae]|uniref:LytTR family transcriptional regulator n=1 Tax=Larkinella terrae TaxID=2025311 RepID=A0A7K0EL40_9BACT|nr:LytTR family DNA-binding domain-containing protein [Larkinella terrae]MRS62422.1 LytTR family transcriptional regulator [Larkinella terrae]